MRFNPALNDLIDLLAEATLRRLERQNPAEAGSCNDPLTAKECINNERLSNETIPSQAANS